MAVSRSSSAASERAYIALGANLGDAPATLAAAIHALAALPGADLRRVSRLYVTRPVGVVDQPDFHNAAVALDVPAGPDPETGALGLLFALKEIERAFGRRERQRWGARELDLDLLLFGRHALRAERPPAAALGGAVAATSGAPSDAADRRLLEVPHPLARKRLFVLAPLADLAPGLRPPGWGETVSAARRRRQAEEGDQAVRVVGRWDPAAGVWMPGGSRRR